MLPAGLLLTEGITKRTNGLHGFASGFSIDLFQNAMDMIPDRKLRNIQMRCNLLVGKTFRDETNQLLLAQRKIRL